MDNVKTKDLFSETNLRYSPKVWRICWERQLDEGGTFVLGHLDHTSAVSAYCCTLIKKFNNLYHFQKIKKNGHLESIISIELKHLEHLTKSHWMNIFKDNSIQDVNLVFNAKGCHYFK